MSNAILFLYNTWSFVSAILAVLGIVSLVYTFVGIKTLNTLGKRSFVILLGCISVTYALLTQIVQANFTEMPTVYNQDLSTAIQSLESRGLSGELAPGVETESEDGSQIVIWASHSKGDLVFKGESILLYTSTSSINVEEYAVNNTENDDVDAVEDTERVIVPDVTEKTKKEAESIITAAGLIPQATYTSVNDELEKYGTDWEGWAIDFQYTPAGAEVDNGTVIYIHATAEKVE
ncbi:MAG: PASTA domain-containing protein [Clostridiales bacterium]|nr:PASTA domain-containing protein [Clostridiales bacterium]